MKKLSAVLLFILFISCKKDTVNNPPAVPPGNPNSKIEADVLVRGQNKHMLSNVTNLARLDFTYTIRYADTICLGIMGSAYSVKGEYENAINIYLTNIKDTGTYIFGQMDSGRLVEIQYIEPSPPCGVGNICLGRSYLANSDLDEGQLTVESISGKKIKGRFQAFGYPVYYNDSTDIVKMTNGRFEGDIP